MMQILGMLKSIEYPLNGAYYDLIDNIIERYESVLEQLFPDCRAEE